MSSKHPHEHAVGGEAQGAAGQKRSRRGCAPRRAAHRQLDAFLDQLVEGSGPARRNAVAELEGMMEEARITDFDGDALDSGDPLVEATYTVLGGFLALMQAVSLAAAAERGQRVGIYPVASVIRQRQREQAASRERQLRLVRAGAITHLYPEAECSGEDEGEVTGDS